MDDLFNLAAQRRCERDQDSPARPTVPHMAIWYVSIEHLFKAQRLSAELQIGRRPMPDARFIFNGANRGAFYLNCIGAPRQPQPLRPERDSPEHQPPSFVPVVAAVDPPVCAYTPHRMRIVAPYAVGMDKGALPGTVREVLNRRNGDNVLITHSCSAPNALVVSADPLGLNWTLCHAACTPVCGHAVFL